MPFATDFDRIYEVIRATVDTGSGGNAECHRLDEIRTPGRITDDLVLAIAASDFCVADLTGINPNVMWELGYAMALAKPVILISQDVETLPFDLRTMRVVPYEAHGSLSNLATDLAKAIAATVGDRGELRHKSWRPGKRMLANGTAWPLRLIDDLDQVLEVNPGEWHQELSAVEITIQHARVQIRAGYRLHHGGAVIMDGVLTGEGVHEGDRAYISYRIRDDTAGQSLTGVLKLILPQWGPITGYYLAESYAKAARTILGRVNLSRVNSV